MPILKITMHVKIQDQQHDRYDDPSGYEEVEIYCTEVSEIEGAAKEIGSTLIKIADVKFKAALAEKAIQA